MELTIRPVRVDDASSIFELKRMSGVRENTLGIFGDTVDSIEHFIRNLTENDHFLIAELTENLNKKNVGVIALRVSPNPKERHCGKIVVFVHKNHQGKGIGKKLLGEIIDIADNWLMLVRLELDVFVDNEKAVDLYKSVGFEAEGIKKYAYIRHGRYDNVFLMARYNKNMVQ